MNRPRKPSRRLTTGEAERFAEPAVLGGAEVPNAVFGVGGISSVVGVAESIRELRLHHSDLRRILSRIGAEFVESSTSGVPVEMADPLTSAFNELWSMMVVHMGREERLVFPALAPALETGRIPQELREGIEWANSEHTGFRSSIAHMQELVAQGAEQSETLDTIGALLKQLFTDFFRHVYEEEKLFANLDVQRFDQRGT